MQRNSTSLFISLLVFAGITFFLDRTGALLGVRGIIEGIFAPGQRTMQSILTRNPQEPLPQEQLLELEKLKRENEDLRMQLGVTSRGQKLIEAHVLSSSRFFIVDKGSDDGVRVGNTVVFKNIYIGKVITVTARTSRVLLPIEKESILSAKTLVSGALGLVKGEGERAIFAEVTLSENLNENDSVITVGDVDEKGLGVRSGFLIGKVSEVRRSDDELFQQALLVPLIEYKNLENVFILL